MEHEIKMDMGIFVVAQMDIVTDGTGHIDGAIGISKVKSQKAYSSVTSVITRHV
jgi:hypothetical protein